MEAYLDTERGKVLKASIQARVSGGGGGTGENGGYYIPSVDDEGNLSWEPSKPNMPDVPTSNIKGPPGSTVDLEFDETLSIKNGKLGVNTATIVEPDNTLPITSAAVDAVVGNIGAILDTI